jgi:hypothetical protein
VRQSPRGAREVSPVLDLGARRRAAV